MRTFNFLLFLPVLPIVSSYATNEFSYEVRKLRSKNDQDDKNALAEVDFEDGSNVKWFEVEGDVLTEVQALDTNDELLALLVDIPGNGDPVQEFKHFSRNPNAPVPPGLVLAGEKLEKNKEKKNDPKQDEENPDTDEQEEEDNLDPGDRKLATSHDIWWQNNYCHAEANHNAMVGCRCYTYLTQNTGTHEIGGGGMHVAVYNIGDSTGSIGYKMEKRKCKWCGCRLCGSTWVNLRSRTVPKGWIYWSWSHGGKYEKYRSRTYGATGALYDFSTWACSDILVSTTGSTCQSDTNF